MKNKKLLMILFSACLLGSVSCSDNQDSPSKPSSSSSNNVISSSGSLSTPGSTTNSIVSTSHSSISSIDHSTTSSNKISSTVSTSIVNSSTQRPTNTYTVVFQNYDGTILETDYNVPHGSMPSYDGITPSREGDENATYNFKGWTPELSEVTSDATYIASFNVFYTGDSDVRGSVPILSEDNKIIEYGLYPQSYVDDTQTINALNNLAPSDVNGWYFYDGNYYVKKIASTYLGVTYNFNNGTSIINGNEYWFKCEPIKWNILSNNNGTYFLLSVDLLDTYNYYRNYDNRNTISPNNYESSDIREWLNNDFYNSAFALNNLFIQETMVDNSASSTDSVKNIYAGEATKDKVFLPSYQDYLNFDYGFDSNSSEKSQTRQSKTSEYARASGAWCNQENDSKNIGSYWTRSPSSKYSYCAWNVNSGGYLSQYAVDGAEHCVRPCIIINL